MNLLILTTTFPESKDDYGTPRFVFDLAKNLSEKNIKTFVLTPDRPNSTKTKEKISKKFSVHRFKYFIKSKQYLTTGEGILPSIRKSKSNLILIPILIIKQFFMTIKIIKKMKIDTINSHWFVPSGLIGAIMQRLYGIKNYNTVHAAGLYLLERFPLGKKIGKFIYSNSTRILVVSNYGKQQLYKLLSKPNEDEFNLKVKVIPMGVYSKEFYQKGGKKQLNKVRFNIFFIGRIVEKKGLIYAIKTIEEMRNENLIFHICGNGPQREFLEKYVLQKKLEEQVIFYGRISEKEKISFFKSADVLLVPSIETREGDKEGLPVVILESLVAGLPIIASNVGGIGDGVVNDYTGLLIKQKSISEIKKAILKLKQDIEFLELLSRNCKKHALKFDWKYVSDQYYTELKNH